MEIKLIELKLENFKGIKKFEFSPGGDNASILGDNATGKTTVADAFRWLLFSKDTQGSADFAIKGVDKSGADISGLDHTVSAAIEIDGVTIKLKKVYKEKWTKRRGEAKRALTGHTTNHFIDGVPGQEKKWNSRLSDMIDGEAFKLVTLPSYFNSLHWNKRREILLEVCGDVTEEDVVKANDVSLGELPEILGDRSLDDHRKVITAENEKINDRLKEIPARIDELAKSLPELRNRKAIEAYINLIDKKIEKARDDTELASMRKELADANVKLSEAKAAHAKETGEANEDIDEKASILRSDIFALKRGKTEIEHDITANQLNIDRNEKNMVELRDGFANVQALQQPYDEICPTCNQALPPDQIEDARSKFNAGQAENLARINKEGKALKNKTEALKELNAGFEKKIKEIEGDIVDLENKMVSLDMSKLPIAKPDPQEIKTMSDEITRLETSIKLHKPAFDTSVLEAERREEMAKLAALDAAEGTKKRIEELKQEEKDLSAKFEDLESQIFLMEKFIVAKVGMLESKINSKFDLARFKLFETQINEGIKECCVTTVNGVPYGSGLNKGMEINVGLDILKTLSEHYEVKAPVWIDNAEAVTKLLDIPSQTFKLIVSKDHKEMEVKYE